MCCLYKCSTVDGKETESLWINADKKMKKKTKSVVSQGKQRDGL